MQITKQYSLSYKSDAVSNYAFATRFARLRVFSSFVTPPLLSHMASKKMKFSLNDDGDNGAWLPLTAQGPAFGQDESILPPRPDEKWYKDDERSLSSKNGDIYVRRPGHDASIKFKENMASRPHGWEVRVDKNVLKVSIRPHVHAHYSVHALLNQRGQNEGCDLKVSYRLADPRTMKDPEVAEFRIQNTADYEEASVTLKGNFALYRRQAQALTKLLR